MMLIVYPPLDESDSRRYNVAFPLVTITDCACLTHNIAPILMVFVH